MEGKWRRVWISWKGSCSGSGEYITQKKETLGASGLKVKRGIVDCVQTRPLSLAI